MVILEVDQLLGMPDFRGAERTFQLLVQAAGRAGRADLPGEVIVQSMRINHPVIQLAMRQDFKAFAERELNFRKALAYPPFSKMILFELNGADRLDLEHFCKELRLKLDQKLNNTSDLLPHVKILGPSVAAIETIRGKHRRLLIISSARFDKLRQATQIILSCLNKPPRNISVRIDVDPQSIL